MATKTADWRLGPTVCRCCLAEGCYKDISTEYFWMGKREVYAEMLSDTFDVSIAYSQSTGPNSNSRLICEPCISRLRDASDFKRQVLECEKTFMQHLDPGRDPVPDVEVPLDPPEKEEVKLERVKLEEKVSDDDFDPGDFGNDPDDDDDDLDDQPLTKLASKIPKKESVDLQDLLDTARPRPDKRKAATKAKASPSKKAKKKETPKATASKVVAKPIEKKKKGLEDTSEDTERSVRITWKRKRRIVEDKANAAFILEHSNAVAFRYQRGKFMCAYCPTVCTNVAEVRDHTTLHDKRDVFKNSEVRNSFPLRVDITNLSCSICHDRVDTLKKLKTHLLENHSKIKDPDYSDFGDGIVPFVLTGNELKCVHCGLLFESFMKLILHMNNHYQDYVCYICGKGFSGKHKLRAHQMNHESGQFNCPKCELVFSNRMTRSRHISVAHGPKQRYRCPICEEHFDSYHSRLRHLDRTHGQKTEYKCGLCPAVFGSGTLRYSHMRTVHKRKRASN